MSGKGNDRDGTAISLTLAAICDRLGHNAEQHRLEAGRYRQERDYAAAEWAGYTAACERAAVASLTGQSEAVPPLRLGHAT